MALQESIKRTETNQQIATAIFHTSISQPSGHSVTKFKVISYELYRNGGPILRSTPFFFSNPSPPPQAELAVPKHNRELIPNTRFSHVQTRKNIFH